MVCRNLAILLPEPALTTEPAAHKSRKKEFTLFCLDLSSIFIPSRFLSGS